MVKELVRRIRPKQAPAAEPRDARRGVPGDMAECDWSPYPVTFTHAPPADAAGVRLHAALLDAQVLQLSREQRAARADGRPRHAFERFGARRARCKYDSQKPVVLRWEGGQPIYNPRFIDFATYYEFSPVACRRRHPERQTPGREKFLRADAELLSRAQLPRPRRPPEPSSPTGWTPSPTCGPSSACAGARAWSCSPRSSRCCARCRATPTTPPACSTSCATSRASSPGRATGTRCPTSTSPRSSRCASPRTSCSSTRPI